jgi:ASC-1-like (ASCH) protein
MVGRGAIGEVLHLNLSREFFDAIATGQKRIEYRMQSDHWRSRLENRKYDVIIFRNGYMKNAPELHVEFGGLRRYGKGKSAYYAIRLGRVLKGRRQRKKRA